MSTEWIPLAVLPVANPYIIPPIDTLFRTLVINLLFIIPLETFGLHLVSERILGVKLKLTHLLGLAAGANLVTAVLGFPVVQQVRPFDYPLGILVFFYVFSSLFEGGTYQFLLRRRGVRFERSFALAFVVNLFTYIPTGIIGVLTRKG